MNVLQSLPAFPVGIKLKLPTVATCLKTHFLMASFLSWYYVSTPLLRFPGITSQMNHLYLFLLGGPNLRHPSSKDDTMTLNSHSSHVDVKKLHCSRDFLECS